MEEETTILLKKLWKHNKHNLKTLRNSSWFVDIMKILLLPLPHHLPSKIHSNSHHHHFVHYPLDCLSHTTTIPPASSSRNIHCISEIHFIGRTFRLSTIQSCFNTATCIIDSRRFVTEEQARGTWNSVDAAPSSLLRQLRNAQAHQTTKERKKETIAETNWKRWVDGRLSRKSPAVAFWRNG